MDYLKCPANRYIYVNRIYKLIKESNAEMYYKVNFVNELSENFEFRTDLRQDINHKNKQDNNNPRNLQPNIRRSK